MINERLVKRQAQLVLGARSVRIVREIVLPCEASLTLWEEHGRKPAHTAALLEVSGSADIICTSASFADFERLVKVLRPTLADIDLLKDLFLSAAPGRMYVVDSRQSLGWMDRYKSVWHEPRVMDGILTFFCNQLQYGRFHRVRISATFDIEVTDIGPGKKLLRR